jgi:biotin synthase-related radical SAM superfamily protein
MSDVPDAYICRICLKPFSDKTSGVEHVRLEHEILEVASYAVSTMMQEQDRDKIAREFNRQLEQIKKEIASG